MQGKVPPSRAVGPRSSRVNVLQTHHCDSQAYPLVLPEAVLTSESPFFLSVLLEPEGEESGGHPALQSTSLQRPFLSVWTQSPTFHQMSQGALTMTHLNPSSKPFQLWTLRASRLLWLSSLSPSLPFSDYSLSPRGGPEYHTSHPGHCLS